MGLVRPYPVIRMAWVSIRLHQTFPVASWWFHGGSNFRWERIKSGTL